MPGNTLAFAPFAQGLALVVLSYFWLFAVLSNLTPVYGSDASSTLHWQTVYSAIAVDAALRLLVRARRTILPPSSSRRLARLVPCVAALCAICEHNLNRHSISASLGPEHGPLINLLACWLPVALAAHASALSSAADRSPFASIALGSGVSWVTAHLLNHFAVQLTTTLTRWGLLATGISLFTLVSPSRRTILPLLLLGALFTFPNPHSPFGQKYLESTLLPQGFRVLERVDSVTGYVSVVENLSEGFLALRCDHSLLGGNWLLSPSSRAGGMKVVEPIYPVFTMLEAVRLIYPTESSQTKQNALVIGLGIGTCPSAFDQHGINTTVIELDPSVTRMARKYFELPSSVTVHDMDALRYVADARGRGLKYQFLVHDVFTGGEEPEALFSIEFLTELRALLRPLGSIAINYAGDLRRRQTWDTIERVQAVFGNCKWYRDVPRSKKAPKDTDFTNVVIFCQEGNRPWAFRETEEADFLQSQLRREYLLPRHGVGPPASVGRQRNSVRSAIDHWRIMREVLPDAVWETW